MSKTVVCYCDGGVCSQIMFYARAMSLVDKGYRVRFDLDIYRKCPLDLSGRFARNFDFPLAFPALPCEEASGLEMALARIGRRLRKMFGFSILPYDYVKGYKGRAEALAEKFPELQLAFRPDLDDVRPDLLGAIADGPSCAVHCRRGDLSSYTPQYGEPPTGEYFTSIIRHIHGIAPEVRFFLFSDEPEWAEENVKGRLPQDIKCETVRDNGSDKGYVDLYLMSLCDYQIASQGSLAKFAWLLSRKPCSIYGERLGALTDMLIGKVREVTPGKRVFRVNHEGTCPVEIRP